jgi:tripartite-type tricarboxylate transporter receptor subunit TctC
MVNSLIRITALCAALVVSGAAFAQQYPTKPVRVVVPFPPGGVTDIATRLIAQKLSERLGQQFYVENIAGAGGNVGMGQVAKAPGDGYTMLFASSSIVVNPNLYNRITYDIEKDFIPVTKAGATPNSWVVNASHPAKTLPELIQQIKSEPGKHSVGSPGAGTTPSLSIEMLKLSHQLDFVTVPFAGGGPMTTALLGNHTPVVCSALGNYANLIKEGKLRALAVTGTKRFFPIPDVPTIADSGVPGYAVTSWLGLAGPAGLPAELVGGLNAEVKAILADAVVVERLHAIGSDVVPTTPDAFRARVADDVAKWTKVVADANIPRV